MARCWRGATAFSLMNSELLGYSLAPDARMIHADEACLILNPTLGTWVKVSRYAGVMCERFLGVDIQGITDSVGPAYGKETLDGLLGLMRDLEARGLLVYGPWNGGGKADVAAAEKRAAQVCAAPARIYVSVTDRCNLYCETCYRHAFENDAPTESVLWTIREAGMFRPAELMITGGEPTLRADLPVLLEEATFNAPKVILATNATLITQEMAEAIASLGVCVQVSIDSGDEAAHDMIRGEGSFKAAIRGIERLVRAGTEHVELVSTIVDPATFNPDDMIELASKHGATFHASLFQEVGRGACSRLKGRRKCPKDLAEAMLRYLLRACHRNALPEDSSFEDVVGLVPREGCGAGSKVFALSGAGNAYPCHLLMIPEFAATLYDISEPPRRPTLKRVEEAHACGRGDLKELFWDVPGVDRIEGCLECDVRYLCGGGCRAAAYAASGSLYGRDPMCEAYRIFISSILWTWDDSHTTSSNLLRALSEVAML